MNAGTSRSATSAALMRDEVRRVAAEVFAQRGPKGATLQDVADALGTSRPALYRYYPSKDALVSEVIRECAEQAAAITLAARSAEQAIDRQLYDLVHRLVHFALERPNQIRLLDATWADLPTDARAIAVEHNRAFFDAVRDLIDDGVRTGVFRGTDSGIAAHAVAALTRSVTWWFDPSGPSSADEVANEIAATAVAGILQHRPPTAEAIRDAIGTVRAGLTGLEDVLDR